VDDARDGSPLRNAFGSEAAQYAVAAP